MKALKSSVGIVSAFLSSSLIGLGTVPSNANSIFQVFRAPSSPKPVAQKRVNGGGSRGCGGQDSLAPGAVILLVPSEEIAHRTVSAQPELFFNVSQIPASPLKFTLVQPGVGEPLVETLIEVDAKGLWSVKLPNTITLKYQQIYFWNVVMLCNETETDQVVRAAIQRVQSSPSLNQALSKSDLLDKAQEYARNGIWYDALATAKQAAQNNPEYWNQLLNEVGFNEIQFSTVRKIEIGSNDVSQVLEVQPF